jgi:glycine hydroxymethyltransferase
MDEAVSHADDEARLQKIAAEVAEMCRGFPAPGIPVS